MVLLDWMSQWMALPTSQVVLLLGVSFIGGLVRGFAGFGLSATIVVVMSNYINPFDLLVYCYLLEILASIVLTRPKTLGDADKPLAFGLVLSYWAGLPVGIFLIQSLPDTTAKLSALSLIMVGATALLFKIKPQGIDNFWGRTSAGITAGVAAGMASVGGLATALYSMSISRPVETIRASLILFLLLTSTTNWVFLWIGGAWDWVEVKRAAIAVPVVILGLITGVALFQPQLKVHYERICLSLLILLALGGLANIGLRVF